MHEPPFIDVGGGHYVACHLVKPGDVRTRHMARRVAVLQQPQPVLM
ncbi:hypothetical protein U7230_06710 [Carboxydochorda subterranea]|uniref:Uncharacterized protein n=1 Tax=Carboxydichorda subterranea TaxID=3109565 RepID=A0ABZ1C0Q6_9FIRM|nr:hypothetical protein [Limnochorda sp. L945t]WRP18685.1 hypothetical protein U7230_06710 [Limnochorda sp. L945t]